MKILFITVRNIDKNGGEQALIYGRHQALHKVYGIETHFIFNHKDTKKIETGIKGLLYIENKVTDFYERIEELLDTGIYQMVVLSGVYDKILNQILKDFKKKSGIIVGLDMHGSLREIYEFCIPDLYHYIGTRYLYLKKKRNFSKTIRNVDFVFIVSDQEIEEINSFRSKKKLDYIKIRCGTTSTIVMDRYYENRKKLRNNFGLDDETLAFVYSGSKDRWQKYSETVNLFKRITETGIKAKFYFYMNLDTNDIIALKDKLGEENVTVKWVAAEQMRREIESFDVGVLLRDYAWTNKVAFPNKFSDYVHAGLRIALSDVVIEPYSISQEYGLMPVSENPTFDELVSILKDRQDNLNEYLQICSDVINNELLYNKQVEDNCKVLFEKMKKIFEV